MNLLIIGATGGTGQELVKQALARGHNVTALVRKLGKLTLTHERLSILRGDVLDYASVAGAMRGQDAVLCALGHKQWFRPTRILSDGTRNIVSAMQTAGVKRFVCETSLSVGDSFGRMGLYYTLFTIPFILPFYFWDKHRQEAVIRASKLDWIIVRPSALTNFRARGKYRHGPNVGNYLWTDCISRADVAEFMLNQLTIGTYLQQSPGVSW